MFFSNVKDVQKILRLFLAESRKQSFVLPSVLKGIIYLTKAIYLGIRESLILGVQNTGTGMAELIKNIRGLNKLRSIKTGVVLSTERTTGLADGVVIKGEVLLLTMLSHSQNIQT